MRLIITLAIALLTSFSAYAQQIIEIDKQFTELNLSGNLRVTLNRADGEDSACRAIIKVYNVDAQRVSWKVKGSELAITLAGGIVESNGYADVEIFYTSLARLTLDGVSVLARDVIRGNNFTLTSTSSINAANLNLEVDDLNINASGNSNIRIAGRSKWVVIKASLGARIDCSDATFADCYVNAGQNAEVIVRSTDQLEAKATTKASVFYFGSPTLKVKTSLAGAVTPVLPPSVK